MLGADVDAVAIVGVGLFAISVCADNTSCNTVRSETQSYVSVPNLILKSDRIAAWVRNSKIL